MTYENKFPVLPGDRVMVLEACRDMHYVFGIVRALYMENITRIFAKLENIIVADMPEYAAPQKWRESQRAECESFLNDPHQAPRALNHPKSLWALVEFNIRVGKTQKKRFYANDFAALQKENRIVIISPNKLK